MLYDSEQSHPSGLAEYLETRFDEEIYSNNDGKNRAGVGSESSASGAEWISDGDQQS